MRKTLIIVDVQNDFSPSGALPVPHGDKVVAVINRIMPQFDHIIATLDWHPADHVSFADNQQKNPGEIIEINGVDQILWPVHCVQSSYGAEFIAGLKKEAIEKIIYKGVDAGIDSYSGFFDNARQQQTGLEQYLRENNLDNIFICGLATDYCVKFTALDAVSLGLTTTVIEDACRAVNLAPGDGAAALQEMERAGCTVITSHQIF